MAAAPSDSTTTTTTPYTHPFSNELQYMDEKRREAALRGDLDPKRDLVSRVTEHIDALERIKLVYDAKLSKLRAEKELLVSAVASGVECTPEMLAEAKSIDAQISAARDSVFEFRVRVEHMHMRFDVAGGDVTTSEVRRDTAQIVKEWFTQVGTTLKRIAPYKIDIHKPANAHAKHYNMIELFDPFDTLEGALYATDSPEKEVISPQEASAFDFARLSIELTPIGLVVKK